MQATVPSVFNILNLADPGALFDHPPAGVDGDAIRQVLHKVLDRIAEAPMQSDAGRRLWLLAEAGRMLLADPAQYAAAIHLTQAAAPDLADSAALAHVRMMAMGRLRHFPDLISEVARLASSASKDAKISSVLKSVTASFGLRLSVPPTIALHRAIWGDLPENLLQKLSSLRNDPGPVMPIPERGLKYIYSHTRVERCSYSEFKERYSWGMVAADYLRFIGRLRAADEAQQDAGLISALQRQIGDELLLPMLTEPSDGGQSNILIMASHVGVANVLGMHYLPKNRLPKSVVARNPRPDFGEYVNVDTSAPDAAVKFVKLVKLVRKGARMTLIFPDGGSGELTNIKILGVPMEIGRGAAMLAYHGKAVTHSIHSTWSGGHLRIALETGPSPVDSEPLESFEPRLNMFYSEGLESILTGPPENIAMFANKFTHALAKEGI